MHTTKYLYGIDPKKLADMPYKEALEYKKEKAKELLEELYKPSFWDRDDQRIAAVCKAIKFTETLLEELKR